MSGEKCQRLIHSLLEYSCHKRFSQQMAIARELFTVATGKVTDEDSFYEQRMAIFQEYFVFDFRLSDIFPGTTVFEEFLWNSRATMSQKEIEEYEPLRSIRRSVFVVEKTAETVLLTTDLVSRKQEAIYALPSFTFTGFEKGRIFEGRTVHFAGKRYFTGSFIFHAEGVRHLIEKQIRDHLLKRPQANATNTKWRAQLRRRDDLVAAVTDKKTQLEQNKERKSVQVLNINRELMTMAQNLGCDRLTLGIGADDEISPYISEIPFFDISVLLDQFAYSELQCVRYRHIDPARIYTSGDNPFDARRDSSLDAGTEEA